MESYWRDDNGKVFSIYNTANNRVEAEFLFFTFLPFYCRRERWMERFITSVDFLHCSPPSTLMTNPSNYSSMKSLMGSHPKKGKSLCKSTFTVPLLHGVRCLPNGVAWLREYFRRWVWSHFLPVPSLVFFCLACGWNSFTASSLVSKVSIDSPQFWAQEWIRVIISEAIWLEF